MSRKIFFKIMLVVLFLVKIGDAYNNLRVLNPRSSWQSMTGTIEEAVVSVRPHGIFMEIGLYLTFSARDWYYSGSDSLEVQFFFDLPEEAAVHDSWLWIGGEIIRGEIMDKWTAAEIYEDIVKRRRDPSILFKRSGTQYELRIFPILAGETRKIKLTYLVPTQWNSHQVMAALPVNLLRTSRYEIPTFYVLSWLQTPWKNPGILEFPDISFVNQYDNNLGDYWRADLPSDAVYGTINFAVDAPFNQEGIYLDSFERSNEGIYQLAFLPSRALRFFSRKKVAVLFDYDATKSNTSPEEVLTRVKAALHTNFAEKDSFNLIFSKLNILRASPSWLACDSTVIEQTFAALSENPISSYSNLPALLADGISFVQENGNNGSLLLVSNSDQVGDFEVANQLMDDILAQMDPEIPLHIADYTYTNYSYHWIGGRAYYGNQYFYTNISRLTSGNYFNRFSGDTFAQVVFNTFSAVNGFVSVFDLHMGLQNGPCYSHYNPGGRRDGVYLDRPVLQIGKYNGALPFLIDISGIYRDLVFSERLVYGEEQILQTDSLSEEAWAGQHIHYLETLPQSNDVVGEIVDYSISERVLSVYSAFLCLEPSRGGEICYDCIDESALVGIEDPLINAAGDSLFFNAYPNPFNSEVNITVSLPNVARDGKTTYKIYNILGQVVRTFKPEVSTPGSTQHFVWHGKNDSGAEISSGTYFFVVRSGEKRYTLKLLLMK